MHTQRIGKDIDRQSRKESDPNHLYAREGKEDFQDDIEIQVLY